MLGALALLGLSTAAEDQDKALDLAVNKFYFIEYY